MILYDHHTSLFIVAKQTYSSANGPKRQTMSVHTMAESTSRTSIQASKMHSRRYTSRKHDRGAPKRAMRNLYRYPVMSVVRAILYVIHVYVPSYIRIRTLSNLHLHVPIARLDGLVVRKHISANLIGTISSRIRENHL